VQKGQAHVGVYNTTLVKASSLCLPRTTPDHESVKKSGVHYAGKAPTHTNSALLSCTEQIVFIDFRQQLAAQKNQPTNKQTPNKQLHAPVSIHISIEIVHTLNEAHSEPQT